MADLADAGEHLVAFVDPVWHAFRILRSVPPGNDLDLARAFYLCQYCAMSSFSVSDIDPEVLAALQRRAARHERTLEEEIASILAAIAREEAHSAPLSAIELNLSRALTSTSWRREEIYEDDEIAEAVKVQPLTGAEIVAAGLTGGWKDEVAESGAEWVERTRRERRRR